MKKIINLYRGWRYRRLYRSLLKSYIAISDPHIGADWTCEQAADAFRWITGYEWTGGGFIDS